MEQFKIEHFQREHPSDPFPWFRTVSLKELEEVGQSLKSLAGLPLTADTLILTKTIWEMGKPCEGINAEKENFSLQNVLQKYGIVEPDLVYLNWYRFQEGDVDQFYLKGLTKYFDDIWYPGPDDIDIFDSTVSWVLSIDHDGRINLLKMEPDEEKEANLVFR